MKVHICTHRGPTFIILLRQLQKKYPFLFSLLIKFFPISEQEAIDLRDFLTKNSEWLAFQLYTFLASLLAGTLWGERASGEAASYGKRSERASNEK